MSYRMVLWGILSDGLSNALSNGLSNVPWSALSDGPSNAPSNVLSNVPLSVLSPLQRQERGDGPPQMPESDVSALSSPPSMERSIERPIERSADRSVAAEQPRASLWAYVDRRMTISCRMSQVCRVERSIEHSIERSTEHSIEHSIGPSIEHSIGRSVMPTSNSVL